MSTGLSSCPVADRLLKDASVAVVLKVGGRCWGAVCERKKRRKV